MNASPAALSVTQLNEYVKFLLESAPVLKNVTVRGEISNYKNHPSGHRYFSLKDEGGTVRCVMFRSAAQRLRFAVEDGMRVLAVGHVSAFVRDGQYQLYCDALTPDGEGALALAYEQLKRRLSAEGLFDPERKKPLPRFPRKIGIITAPTGAAVRDMIQVTGRRFPAAEILLFPALVQGEGAVGQLVEGLRCLNENRAVDVIIIGRGGGSMEDLWAFNEEPLVRAVAASEIPVISAVGHETDFTLCDFAADCRAPTPSAAAELAVPDRAELLRTLQTDRDLMRVSLKTQIDRARHSLEALASRRVMTSPLAPLEEKRMLLLSDEKSLIRAAELLQQKKRSAYTALTAKLQALDPMAVITRGYAAVFNDEGELLRSVHQTQAGRSLNLRLGDGQVRAKVECVTPNEE